MTTLEDVIARVDESERRTADRLERIEQALVRLTTAMVDTTRAIDDLTLATQGAVGISQDSRALADRAIEVAWSPAGASITTSASPF